MSTVKKLTPREFERAKQSAPTGNPMAALYAAKARARGEFPDIPRRRVATVRMKAGGSYSYSYADLSDVFAAINPVLSAFGLDVAQWPEGATLYTRISHKDGAQEVMPWPIKPMPQRGLDDAQAFQAAVQVAKRYALTAALGITTEETVEGNARTGGDNAARIDDKFQSGDGIRLPRGAKWDAKMSPRQLAEEAARAIEEQFREVKTSAGMDGVWSRNSMFIEKFRDNHPDLYSNLFDIYQMMSDEKDASRSE